MRPFEIVRLKRQNLDLDGLWLAVHGKPHAIRLAFRRVPILPELLPAFHAVLEIRGRVALSSNLIGFYGRDGGWQAVEQASLENIPFEASQRAGVPVAPDLYSLRHRFRTDMLANGMSEHHLNYLMGHESRGTESYSVYLDRMLDDLVAVYQPMARQLAIRYGLIESDGQR
jgi:integrase